MAEPDKATPAPECESVLKTLLVRRKGVLSNLVPVQLHLFSENEALREAVVSLYHHVLPEVSKQFIRELIFSSKVYTLVFRRSEEDVRRERRERLENPEKSKTEDEAFEKRRQEKLSEFHGDDGEDEDTSSYSDSDAEAEKEGDEEEDSEADDDPEEDKPLKAVDDPVTPKERLVGCVSYEFVENDLRLRILQVTLIGTRTKFQTLGVGGRLMETVKSKAVVGDYDVLITYADHSAVPFFKRHGLSEDVILNSRFRRITDKWDQSVLMCYYPSEELPADASPIQQTEYSDVKKLDRQIDEWRERRVEEYAKELALIDVMRREIQNLRRQVVHQQKLMDLMSADLSKEKRERTLIEKEFAVFRERAIRNPPSRSFEDRNTRASSTDPLGSNAPDTTAAASAFDQKRPRVGGSFPNAGRHSSFPSSLELELAHLCLSARSSAQISPSSACFPNLVLLDPLCREYRHVCDELSSSIRPVHGISSFNPTLVYKASPDDLDRQRSRFTTRLQTMHDTTLNLRLYFGGPPHLLAQALRTGLDLFLRRNSHALSLALPRPAQQPQAAAQALAHPEADTVSPPTPLASSTIPPSTQAASPEPFDPTAPTPPPTKAADAPAPHPPASSNHSVPSKPTSPVAASDSGSGPASDAAAAPVSGQPTPATAALVGPVPSTNGTAGVAETTGRTQNNVVTPAHTSAPGAQGASPHALDVDYTALNIYGDGLYFTKYASKAHHFTEGGGHLLLCLVALGRSETVVCPDPYRSSPSTGYDSIYTPGRRMPSESQSAAGSGSGIRLGCGEEYVVFDPSQVLPMYLIAYQAEP